jgi:hypothetical protein
MSAWKTLELCYDEMSKFVKIESGRNWHKFVSICKCFIEFQNLLLTAIESDMLPNQ